MVYATCMIHVSLLWYTAEEEEAPPPGGWSDVQVADPQTAMAQQVADLVSMIYVNAHQM